MAGGVDAMSDVYSLGVVLYEMLAGQLPFTGTSPGVVLGMHLMQAPPPLQTLAPVALGAPAAVASRAVEESIPPSTSRSQPGRTRSAAWPGRFGWSRSWGAPHGLGLSTNSLCR